MDRADGRRGIVASTNNSCMRGWGRRERRDASDVTTRLTAYGWEGMRESLSKSIFRKGPDNDRSEFFCSKLAEGLAEKR